MPELSQNEKIKLAGAVGLLLVAVFLIYWFGIRTPKPDLSPIAPEAAVSGSAKPGEALPAANRRVVVPQGKGK